MLYNEYLIDHDLLSVNSFNFSITCKKINLNVLSSTDIFDIDAKDKEEKEQKEIEKFISEMKGKVFVDDTDDVGDKIKKLGFEKEIIDKALFYFEKATDYDTK